jgi:hypothetical protein
MNIMAGALFMAVLATGCASIVNGGDQKIRLSTTPSNASYRVINSANRQEVATGLTPAEIDVQTKQAYMSGANYEVQFFKDGFEKANTQINTKLSGWYFANFLLPCGVICGMLIIDPITGGMWSFEKDDIHSDLNTASAPKK